MLVTSLLAGCGGIVNLDPSGTGGRGDVAQITTGGAANGTGGMATAMGGQATGGVAPCHGLPHVPRDSGAICAGTSSSCDRIAIDLYLILDRNRSMSAPTHGGQSTRLADAAIAIEKFMTDEWVSTYPVQVGIQFFGISGGTVLTIDCDPWSYALPAVEIGPLGTVAPVITSLLDGLTPAGEAPSVPALLGAIQRAGAWQAYHPLHETRVVVITDGVPTLCDDQSEASWLAAAQAGLASDPPIRTHVFGLNAGASAYRLHDLAASGGTDHAVLIDDANLPSDLTAALVEMLAGFNPVPCEYWMPPPPNGLVAISYDQVEFIDRTLGGGEEEVPYATSLAGCSPTYGGWYYDRVPSSDPNAPTPSKLILCPCTCAAMQFGCPEILLACHPVISSSP
jgi:hypothetical protein